MERKEYQVKADVPKLLNELKDFLQQSKYDPMSPIDELSGFTLKASKTSTLRDWTGFSHSITIRIAVEPTKSIAWVGEQRWFEKGMLASLGVLLQTPFLGGLYLISSPVATVAIVAALIGGYQQYKLTRDIWEVVDQHMARQSRANSRSPSSY